MRVFHRIAFFLSAFAPLTATAAERPVVVVELFTSQGCSACPPADALAREIAERPDALVLAYHVDYWDYLGWADPFATPENTRRQRDYAAWFRTRTVYTPQVIVNGAEALVGSRRAEVVAAVDRAAGSDFGLRLSVAREGDSVLAAAAPGAEAAADIVLVAYGADRTIRVGGGENAGRALRVGDHVREWRVLGTVEAEGGAWRAPWPQGAAGVAVLAQGRADGRILGAARYEPEGAAVSASVAEAATIR